MPRARGNIEFEDLRPGTGETATREHIAEVSLTMSLHRGEVVCTGVHEVHLHLRETIAGLRYGIEGMRVGGKRRITIPPHLGYGAHGLPDLIPPNALHIAEVELLSLRPARPRRAHPGNTNDDADEPGTQ